MPKAAKTAYSPEVVQEATQLAKKVQKPGQTKEQTKLVELGIRKGLAIYKQQQKAKLREQDKLRKKQLKQQEQQPFPSEDSENDMPKRPTLTWLPWLLLAASWLGFAGYSVLPYFNP